MAPGDRVKCDSDVRANEAQLNVVVGVADFSTARGRCCKISFLQNYTLLPNGYGMRASINTTTLLSLRVK